MQITKIPTHILEENTYVIHTDKECILIDPGSDTPEDLQAIKEVIGTKEILAILCTHNHFDHIGGLHCFNSPIYMHSEDIKTIRQQQALSEFAIQRSLELPRVVLPLENSVKIGPFSCKVIHTPGHTKGGVCFLFNKFIITGDTLFKGTHGRTDLLGGSHNEIVKSLLLLASLDEKLVVYPGHGSKTTILAEKDWIQRLK